MCSIFYSFISKVNPQFLNDKLLSFPESIKLGIEKYNIEKDRAARILSKLLLLKGLSHLFPLEKIDLAFLERNGKPIIKNIPIHFNSAHSEDLVMVTFSKLAEIGVDVEFNKNINTAIYKDFFQINEQKLIDESNNQLAAFYGIWTKKEALLKADGIGINADFKTIDCSKSETKFNGQQYFFKEILLDVNYTCYVSSTQKIIEIDCREIVF